MSKGDLMDECENDSPESVVKSLHAVHSLVYDCWKRAAFHLQRGSLGWKARTCMKISSISSMTSSAV